MTNEPVSFRLGKHRPTVEAIAAERGLKIGAACLVLIEYGLERITLPAPRIEVAKQVLVHAEANAAHLGKPKRSRWAGRRAIHVKLPYSEDIKHTPGARLDKSYAKPPKAKR